MYTVTEVATMFSVSRQTVLKWINNGKIKAVKVVKVYRIPKEEIDRLIDKQRKEVRMIDYKMSLQNTNIRL